MTLKMKLYCVNVIGVFDGIMWNAFGKACGHALVAITRLLMCANYKRFSERIHSDAIIVWWSDTGDLACGKWSLKGILAARVSFEGFGLLYCIHRVPHVYIHPPPPHHIISCGCISCSPSTSSPPVHLSGQESLSKVAQLRPGIAGNRNGNDDTCWSFRYQFGG